MLESEHGSRVGSGGSGLKIQVSGSAHEVTCLACPNPSIHPQHHHKEKKKVWRDRSNAFKCPQLRRWGVKISVLLMEQNLRMLVDAIKITKPGGGGLIA